MIMMKPRNITVPYTPPFQPMETPTRHSFEHFSMIPFRQIPESFHPETNWSRVTTKKQVITRESSFRKFLWRKLKTAGIFLFNRNTHPIPSIQSPHGDLTFPSPRIQPASTTRSQKCRKGSRRDSGIGPSLHEERSPHTSPERGEKEET